MSAVAAKYTETYPRGHVLFEEGDPGSKMYVLRSGRVQLTRKIRGEEKILCVLPSGECFGEMALLLGRPRSATAVVVEEATLLAIDAATFEDMIQSNAAIAVRLLKTLARRLSQANQQVETLLLPDHNHRVVHALMGLAEAIGEADTNGVRIPLSSAELADHVGISVGELGTVIERLSTARLVTTDPGRGFWVAELGRLHEFLEFLDLKERFGG
jgi:CRP-like cAMP-binding protein